jgi:hypothetical protein
MKVFVPEKVTDSPFTGNAGYRLKQITLPTEEEIDGYMSALEQDDDVTIDEVIGAGMGIKWILNQINQQI